MDDNSEIGAGSDAYPRDIPGTGARMTAVDGKPALGADFVAELQRRIPQIVEDIVELVREDAPDYAAFLTSDEEDVGQVAEEAVRRLVAMADSRRVPDSTDLDLEPFVEIGRWEWRSGRSLRMLLAAYRAGARVAWRHLADVAIDNGVTGQRLAALAEAIFAFIDELSAASARGYAEEQSRSAGEFERMQFALADLLLASSPEPDAIDLAAARLHYTVAATYALVVAPPDEEAGATALAGRLGAGALPLRRPGMLAALVPDPDGPARRGWLCSALAGWKAIVGWTTPAGGLHASVSATDLALALVQRGVIPAGDPTFVADHLGTLVVHGDPVLLAQLTVHRLAPLADLPEGSRARLLETLRTWIDLQGDRQEMAASLHVHPQTIRYRLGQLRQHYGEALDDPQVRFELSLVLHALCPKGET